MALHVLKVESHDGRFQADELEIAGMPVFGAAALADASGEVGELPPTVTIEEAIHLGHSAISAPETRTTLIPNSNS